MICLESRPTDQSEAASNLYLLAGHENTYWKTRRTVTSACWQSIQPRGLPDSRVWSKGRWTFYQSFSQTLCYCSSSSSWMNADITSCVKHCFHSYRWCHEWAVLHHFLLQNRTWENVMCNIERNLCGTLMILCLIFVEVDSNVIMNKTENKTVLQSIGSTKCRSTQLCFPAKFKHQQ